MATLSADIEQALIDALEFIDGYVDVVDGDYGEPAPNRAMTIASNIREVLAKLERAEKAAAFAASLETLNPIMAAAIKPHLHD